MSFKIEILLIPLLQAISHSFEISEDDHPPNTPTPLVTHARDHWWTLDFANAFVSPGVNSRAELFLSPRAYARNGAPVGSGIHFRTFFIPSRLDILTVWEVIYEQRERVIHCFRVFGYRGETRARVVYMASQMNRDVTECFRLLIWIEYLTKHIVIRNSIEIHIG
jgi:hypothetical protein